METVRSYPGISIRDSPIHGKGVFATQTIPAGTVVVEYLGERISRDEAERREALTGPNGITYILEYDARLFIDGAVGGSEARFINHSCNPNCAIRRDEGRAYFYATRTIQAGDELSIDYAFDPDDIQTPCDCGTPECRGLLNQTAAEAISPCGSRETPKH